MLASKLHVIDIRKAVVQKDVKNWYRLLQWTPYRATIENKQIANDQNMCDKGKNINHCDDSEF